jgi:adenylate kinase family enzyme
MLDPPGAGKSTQAERLARERNLLKISTSDVLRQAIKRSNPIGLQATIEQGKLADDATMIAIVRDRLRQPDTARGFVLDGFPRTVAQAEALDMIISERNNGPLIVVNIGVPKEELVRRLNTRRIVHAAAQTVTHFPANDNFMELLFWVDALRRASAESVTVVVIPYFSYAKGTRKTSLECPFVPVSALTPSRWPAQIGS